MFTEAYLPLLLLILAVGTFAGGLLPVLRKWSEDSLSLLLAFGSGVILAVIFLQMVPVTFQLTGLWGGAGMLAGFVATSLMEAEFHAHRAGGGHAHEGAHARVAGFMVAMGMAVHSAMDGLVLGAGLTRAELAPSVFFAILLHKGPDAFALTTVLLAAGLLRARILVVQGLFSLTTPLAAVCSYYFLLSMPDEAVGIAVGLAAGILLAVVSEDLLPEVHRRRGRSFIVTTAALLGGIAMVLAYLLALH